DQIQPADAPRKKQPAQPKRRMHPNRDAEERELQVKGSIAEGKTLHARIVIRRYAGGKRAVYGGRREMARTSLLPPPPTLLPFPRGPYSCSPPCRRSNHRPHRAPL